MAFPKSSPSSSESDSCGLSSGMESLLGELSGLVGQLTKSGKLLTEIFFPLHSNCRFLSPNIQNVRVFFIAE